MALVVDVADPGGVGHVELDLGQHQRRHVAGHVVVVDGEVTVDAGPHHQVGGAGGAVGLDGLHHEDRVGHGDATRHVDGDDLGHEVVVELVDAVGTRTPHTGEVAAGGDGHALGLELVL